MCSNVLVVFLFANKDKAVREQMFARSFIPVIIQKILQSFLTVFELKFLKEIRDIHIINSILTRGHKII